MIFCVLAQWRAYVAFKTFFKNHRRMILVAGIVILIPMLMQTWSPTASLLVAWTPN